MKVENLLANLKKLKFSSSEFVVVGSGALAIRGIREAKDVDMIVTESLWNELSKKYPVINNKGFDRLDLGNDIEVLGLGSPFTDSSTVPVNEIFKNADEFDGIKFINFDHLKKIKKKMGREKDFQDIAFIDQYLATQQ